MKINLKPVSFLSGALHDLSRMFFPICCPVCHRALVDGEQLLCTECHWNIPRTNYHLSTDNQLLQKLVSLNAPVEKAAAYFLYKNDNPYGQLIKDAKYNGRPWINRQLARLFARELLADGFFDDIDIIIPVPTHWMKRLRRGYNQTEYIAGGISEITGIPVACNLVAKHNHKTQTKKHVRERRKSLAEIFDVEHPDELAGRHILLVDDVITTGSTIIACAETIIAATKNNTGARTRLSILSLATTRLSS